MAEPRRPRPWSGKAFWRNSGHFGALDLFQGFLQAVKPDRSGSRVKKLFSCFGLLCLFPGLAVEPLEATQKPESYRNRYGIKMVLVQGGDFMMGNHRITPSETLKQSPVFINGGSDEKPVHPVRITYDFYISETEITAEQFNRFHEDHEDVGMFSPYASGMSWEDAMGYCEWLSAEENKDYRLPTEAEWEYVARAGSVLHFSSGDLPPATAVPNAWAVRNMHSATAEWVYDWHGDYPPGLQVDPVGPASGMARVVRGGGLNMPYHGGSKKYPNDGRLPYFRRCANRAALPPQLRGRHNVGFRIVEAPLPDTEPYHPPVPLNRQFVRQENPWVRMGPDLDKPWFRQRDLLSIPVELASNEEIRLAGLHPSMHGHNHDPGLAVAPNGDLIAVHFSATIPTYEDLTDVNIIAARLRFGADEWDKPSPFFDLPGTKDIGPVITNDDGRLLFAAGGGGLDGVVFRWRWSDDNGATWSPVQIPLLYGRIGPYYPQPINNFYRDQSGHLYLATDGVEGTSFLWGSHDNGHTWFDTGGRTGGRHTIFAFMADGSILGLGGKASDIDGYMPMSISRDLGKSWSVRKTPFPAVGPSGQKAAFLRLASGRLFAAADYLNTEGKGIPGISDKSAWVALSEDQGMTWHRKTLPGVRPSYQYETPHVAHDIPGVLKDGTIGYAMAVQAPNGIIHLLSSKNYPSQHWEMNEAWILSPSTEYTAVQPTRTAANFKTSEQHENGTIKASWGGTRDSTGRFLLDGPEVHHYATGQKQYAVTWKRGRKEGPEFHWDGKGNLVWQWEHGPDQSKTWTHYWPNGLKRLQSNWQGNRCHGPYRIWDQEGNLLETGEFRNGILVENPSP